MDADSSQSVGKTPDNAHVTGLTLRIKQEIERYRQNGNLLRYAGTGSAIAGGAASLLPLAAGGIPFLPLLGLGVAGFALIKQKARDEHIYQLETRLSDILVSPDPDPQPDQLAALLAEILEANGRAE